jgi:glyoxylase-like metal-dependent hydrolase (beta-lactamase superfamily II)
VWRITTPLPFRPRQVHAYLLRDSEGWVLVDGGLGWDEAWQVLDEGVRMVAGGWQAVKLHVVTHMHMDHVGLAARTREAARAPLAMGRLDAERMAHAAAQPGEEAEYRARLLRSAGAPDEVLEALESQRAAAADLAPPVPVDLPLSGDGGTVPGAPGWRWMWTPGHTAGHISLFRPEDRTLIAGDAVMDGITPTLGVNRQREDPVGDYLGALGRLAALSPALILAGHGEPAAPERIDALREATLAEADALAALFGSTPLSTWQVAMARYAGRQLPVSAQMLALRETRAHLDRLARPGGALRRQTREAVDWFERVE